MSYSNSPIMLAASPRPYRKRWNFNNSSMVAQAIATGGSTNGSQVQKLGAVHTSTLAPNYFVCRGQTVSGPSINTGALVSGSPVTITRGTGSFVTDGWSAGETCWVNGATTYGNGLVDHVGTVATATLTLTQNTIFSAESFAGAAQTLVRLYSVGVLLAAVATASVPVMNNLLTSSVIVGILPNADAYLDLGPSELLVFKPSRTGQSITDITAPLGTTVAAYLDVCAEMADW